MALGHLKFQAAAFKGKQGPLLLLFVQPCGSPAGRAQERAAHTAIPFQHPTPPPEAPPRSCAEAGVGGTDDLPSTRNYEQEKRGGRGGHR